MVIASFEDSQIQTGLLRFAEGGPDGSTNDRSQSCHQLKFTPPLSNTIRMV
jgi:hypothetical protein